jgi:predicted outer membrane repeat protein
MLIDAVNFTQNTAVGYGGGIAAASSFMSVRKSIFSKN